MSDVTSPISVEVEVNQETSQTVVDAALDVFSVGTELLGWAGDSIRIHRANSALKCFARTKQIAKEQGLKLTHPPVKFLAQYIENSSLEEAEDTTLIEWWARVLVEASSDYKNSHLYYTSVLKQISAIELELLECVVRNGRRDYRIALAAEAEFVSDFNFTEDDLFLTDQSNDSEIEKSINSILEELEIPGSLILDVFVDDENSNQWQIFHPDYSDEELSSWQILASLQLIKLDYVKFKKGSVHFRARRAVITQLGSEFYFCCHEPQLLNAMSSRERFERKHKPKVSPARAAERLRTPQNR